MVNDDQIERWIAKWEEAGKSLISVRKKELQSEGYYEMNKEILNHMLQYVFNNHKVRLSSGLVTQQNLFRKYNMGNK